MRDEALKKELVDKFERDVEKRSWFMRLLLVLDQLGNVVFFNGSQDETISSHIGRTGKAKWLCKLLRGLQSRHCIRSIGE